MPARAWEFKSPAVYHMRRCRNRYTSRFQKPVPKGMRVRSPLCAPYTLLAQSVEQQTFNLWVGGPIPPGRTTSEEGCSIPLLRFAQEPRKLHIHSLLLPSPHRTTLRWGPYTDVAQLADASDLRSEKLWVRGPPSVPVFVACSSVGRAPGCGPEGRRFESAHAPHTGECRSLVKRDGL